MPGFYYLPFAYYIFIMKYFHTKKIKYALLAGVLFIIYILMGTRQIIAIIVLLTLFSILRSRILTNKFFVLFTIMLCGVAVFYIFQPVIMKMFAVTVQQMNAKKENIRLVAAHYFLYDFFPNKISYFFGNGADSLNSSYGLWIQYLKYVRGLYQSDVGIIGDFSKFGILYILACLSITIKVFRAKLPEYYSFIKLIFAGMILASLTGLFPFGDASSIVAFSFLLYLFDVYKNKTGNEVFMESKPSI